PETGGSDAHFLELIGSALTRFPGQTADDLRTALTNSLTIAEQRRGAGLRTIGVRRLVAQQGRGLSATPRATVARPLRRHVSRMFARPS
ncbi:MAG TPA: PHP-associated domain-containing protein, partial [Dehalococcoidia bacterium]|nr:PHP-associated domain-containing protein [Dehalococcoidia bacterium]